MRKLTCAAAGIFGLLSVAGAAVAADEASSSGGSSGGANNAATPSAADTGAYAPAKQQPDGMWVTKSGEPTYHVGKDGTLGWYAFDGYLQYSANCLQCHGPDGLGSSYAPNLTNVMKTLSYAQFLGIVAGGMKSVNASQDLVMPSFGLNKNVMCYINPIYIYLRGRSEGAIPRGRPDKHEPVPPAFNKEIDDCMG